MDGKGAYRLFVTDVEAQEVAFLGSISEAKTPAMIALRLKIANRQIAEIETFIQRSPSSAQGFERIGYKWTDEVPPAERMSREDLIKTANMYFSGMQKNDGKGVYPFADDCNRIENGGITTNTPVANGKQTPDPKTATGYSANWSCKEQFDSGLLHFVTRIRDRRFVAVDPERGLVFSLHLLRSLRRRHPHLSRLPTAARSPPAPISSGPGRSPSCSSSARAHKAEGRSIRSKPSWSALLTACQSGWSDWEDGLSDRGRDATKRSTQMRTLFLAACLITAPALLTPGIRAKRQIRAL